MPIEHVNAADPDIHEPKGVSTATAGDIYVADGLGGGSWEPTAIANHGEMSVTNNSTATAVTIAGDATLNTDADYVKVTAGWAAPHLHGVTFNADELICAVSGHYELSFWSSIKVPLNNNFIGIKYAVNDVAPYSAQKLVGQSVTTNDYKTMAGHGGIDLTAGDTVSIYIAATKTDNIVVEEAGMSMLLIHEM